MSELDRYDYNQENGGFPEFEPDEPMIEAFDAEAQEAQQEAAEPAYEVPQQPPVMHSASGKREKPKKEKKKHEQFGLKIAAIALVCALLGGVGGGFLGAEYMRSRGSDTTAAQTPSTPTSTEPSGSTAATPAIKTNTSDVAMTPKQIYAKYVSAVVGIANESTTTNIFGQVSATASSGSGFIISSDGYIVTNYHVVEGASTLTVTLYDGKEYPATVVGYEATNDVALLKIDATGLTAVSIGDSDSLAVGDQVSAIGNPLGELTYTMTVGYISALDRVINTDGTPINMMQTDAAINSGNSGGPLFDSNGNVVGITTAKYSGSTNSGTTIEGLGFAIPINDVMKIVNDLKQYGYVVGQPYLGIYPRDLDTSTAAVYGLPVGVYVSQVVEGNCAAKAGVQQGDIITAIGDYEISSYAELAAALKKFSAGDQTTLSIYRAGQTLKLDITLDEKPREEQTDSSEQGQTQETEPSQGSGNSYGYGNENGGFPGFQFP